MKVTVTYNVDEEMMEMIEDILEDYEPSDFEHEDDREVFLADIAITLVDEYFPLLEETIIPIVEKYLKKKGWIK
jgi:hypothetical protein